MELGPGGNELLESTAYEDEERRALDKRKYLALSRRCKEIEQVCASLHLHAFSVCVLFCTHFLPVWLVIHESGPRGIFCFSVLAHDLLQPFLNMVFSFFSNQH